MTDTNRRTALDANEPCPICCGCEWSPWRFGLLDCAGCGVVVSPLIWQPGANDLMEEEFFGDSYQRDESWWVAAFERWNNRRTLARLAAAGARRGRLLEIGIGSGSFLAAARDTGFEVLGCDLSPVIAERVRTRRGLPVHLGTVQSLDGEARFDVVVMNHVLEHTADPVDFLRAVHRLLKPGGIVHVAVPNVQSWEARLSGWTSYEPYHLVYFSRSTLGAVAKLAGLEVRMLCTHESFSGWFLALLRTAVGIGRSGAVVRTHKPFGRDERPSRSSPLEHVYRLAMVAAGAVSWPLRRVQALAGFGDELVMIAGRAPQSEV